MTRALARADDYEAQAYKLIAESTRLLILAKKIRKDVASIRVGSRIVDEDGRTATVTRLNKDGKDGCIGFAAEHDNGYVRGFQFGVDNWTEVAE